MKKTIAILLSAFLGCALLVSCTPVDNTPPDDGNKDGQVTPGEDDNQTPGGDDNDPNGGGDNTPDGDQGDGAEDPGQGDGTDNPGDGEEQTKLRQVYDAVMKEMFPDGGPSMMQVETAEEVEEMTGITSDMADEVLISMAMINTQVDSFIGVLAKDGKVADVEKALNDYRDKIIAQREEFPYLPDHLPKAKGAQVVTEGNYVFYLSLSNSENYPEDTEDLQSAVDTEIQRAVDAVKAQFEDEK